MHILVTGGAGYIGSHTVLELLNQGHKVTVIDNLCNSSQESLNRVQKLTGKKIEFYNFDVRNEQKLSELFKSNSFDAVIHFAGLKSVSESVEMPLEYYSNNLVCTLVLLKVMKKHNVKSLVFSSSANVYGDASSVPVYESFNKQPTNPYGQTKAMIEQILEDLSNTKSGWQVTSLRYFNPVGADPSGEIGEDPDGVPPNLLPYVSQVAVGRIDRLKVFGNDYPTPDGTGVRDYIHVVDLAKAHIAAIKHIGKPDVYRVYNIGTGKGTSVLEIIKAFSDTNKIKIDYSIEPRRPNDVAISYANVDLAKKELGWKAKKSIEDACRDAWNWQSKNPKGFKCVE